MQGKVEFVPRHVWTHKKDGESSILPSLLSSLADETLIERLIDNDQAAFQELVLRHTKRFYRHAYRTLRHKEDAEDVVQDCFIKLWRRPDMWQPDKDAKFTTWFYQIILNACRDRLRMKRPTTELESDTLISEETSAEDKVIRWQRDATIKSAVQTLPPRQVEALTLVVYEDLNNKDAAEIMGVNLKAFESLLTRAKEGLKKYFAQVKAEDKHDTKRI